MVRCSPRAHIVRTPSLVKEPHAPHPPHPRHSPRRPRAALARHPPRHRRHLRPTRRHRRQRPRLLSDDYDPDALRPHAERLFKEIIAQQLREQATWPTITDCDRFDAAFAALEASGIVCRHNFSCCGTCAAGEIWDEIDAERAKGRPIVGCVHYNVQTLETAIEGGGVYLSYGSVEEGDESSVAIGHRIVSAMQANGLSVTWDGTIRRRIHVALDWKRRLRL